MARENEAATSAVPEAIQQRLAHLAATFIVKHHVPLDDVTELMMDVIGIYDDYLSILEEPGS